MPRKAKVQDSSIRSLDSNGFYSIISKKDCLYAALVRSPAPSGIIKSINCPNLPEGYFLFDSKDIPGSRFIECNNLKTKIFGFDNVSYQGEAYGILLGPDESKVYELLKSISFNFDIKSLESAVQQVITKQKRPVISLQENNKDLSDFVDIINDLPSLDTVLDKNLLKETKSQIVARRLVTSGIYKDKANQYNDKEFFENSDFQLEQKYNQKLVNPTWYENDGAFAYFEAGLLHVYTPTKWTYNLQKALEEVLDLPSEKIYIHKTNSSGIYTNGLLRTNVLAVQVALATYLTKKPVKLILTPQEQSLYMAPGVNVNLNYKACGRKDGKITALKANIDIDLGFENPFAQEITDRMAIAVCNFYKPENLFISVKAHTSKNPPTTIHLKSVDSQILFATENLIQSICDKLNLFPDEVKLINLKENKNSSFPFISEFQDIEKTITDVVKDSDFNRKYASFHMDAIDRVEQDSQPFFALPLRGIGIASAYNISGYCGKSNFASDTKMEITLNSDNRLIIHALKPSSVIQKIWKTTASEILQIPIDNIFINSDFELNEMPKSPEDTFSSIGIFNELVRKCCNEIQRKRFHQPLPISSKKSISSIMKKNWDPENFKGNPFHTTSSITTAIEVELDNYTYRQKITGIWIEIDCGELYDESAAIRTIKLEIQQELSTLVEGKTLEYENLHIKFNKSSKKSGQIGELIHNSLPAAFSTAMSLALASPITELPVTEKQIYNLIKNRSSRNINRGNE